MHIQSNVDAPKGPSDIDVDEQEVTQSSESDTNETTHQQLRRSNRIRRPNPKYANAAMVEDEVNELETYEEA